MSTNIAKSRPTRTSRFQCSLSWDAARGVTRLTVDEKLQPGEYAIVENRPDGEVDLYLWDFGVDWTADTTNPAP